MKIIIKQEADTTCAWIVGEDGETLPYSETNPTDGDGTAYLKDGQQVEIDVEIAAVGTEEGQRNYPKATLGDVVQIPASGVDPEADQKEDADETVSQDDQPGGANDQSVLR